jgi:2,5-diketo-D-gluconate reductase B
METLATQSLRMPRLGFGTFRLAPEVCRAAVESALSLGYRHIDTAEMYGNETQVGEAIAASCLARSELHVTTKVWHEHLAPDAIRRAFDASLKKLKLDVVDMRARAIGVCNFPLPLLKAAIDEIGAPIACNQVEYHVFLEQRALLTYLRAKGVPLVAYAPLAQGAVADNTTLQAIGRKHEVSAAQVALAWLLDQPGVAAIPKAARLESQKANLAALDLKLDNEDRTAIAALPKDQRRVNPPFAPQWDPPTI